MEWNSRVSKLVVAELDRCGIPHTHIPTAQIKRVLVTAVRQMREAQQKRQQADPYLSKPHR
jgi:hypothetical protein